MLDFENLIVEDLSKKPSVGVIPVILIILGIILIWIIIALFNMESDPGAFPIPLFLLAAIVLQMFYYKISLQQTVTVPINPSVKGVENLVDGETIVKKTGNYYFVDVLTHEEVKELQRTNKLNKKVLQDFEEILNIYGKGELEAHSAENPIVPPAQQENTGKCTCGQETQ